MSFSTAEFNQWLVQKEKVFNKKYNSRKNKTGFRHWFKRFEFKDKCGNTFTLSEKYEEYIFHSNCAISVNEFIHMLIEELYNSNKCEMDKDGIPLPNLSSHTNRSKARDIYWDNLFNYCHSNTLSIDVSIPRIDEANKEDKYAKDGYKLWIDLCSALQYKYHVFDKDSFNTLNSFITKLNYLANYEGTYNRNKMERRTYGLYPRSHIDACIAYGIVQGWCSPRIAKLIQEISLLKDQVQKEFDYLNLLNNLQKDLDESVNAFDTLTNAQIDKMFIKAQSLHVQIDRDINDKREQMVAYLDKTRRIFEQSDVDFLAKTGVRFVSYQNHINQRTRTAQVRKHYNYLNSPEFLEYIRTHIADFVVDKNNFHWTTISSAYKLLLGKGVGEKAKLNETKINIIDEVWSRQIMIADEEYYDGKEREDFSESAKAREIKRTNIGLFDLLFSRTLARTHFDRKSKMDYKYDNVRDECVRSAVILGVLNNLSEMEDEDNLILKEETVKYIDNTLEKCFLRNIDVKNDLFDWFIVETAQFAEDYNCPVWNVIIDVFATIFERVNFVEEE